MAIGLLFWKFLLFSILALCTALRRKNSIVMTMILRDEAVNIKSNLPLWLSIVDYFVFMVDTRTQDDTHDAIKSILRNKEFKIVPYLFDGFGPARTASLQNAWKHFPHATHVWIADPDWKPDTSTININDLDDTSVFRFLIYDRNGETTRRCDWLLRHREGLAMKYYLHEVLDIGYYEWKVIDWVLHEIEQKGSWHTTVGHENSMSAKRYLFDLELLEKDLLLYGHDPHTHRYLGVTHDAYAERMLAAHGFITPEIEHHMLLAIKFLTLRVTSTYDDEFLEERWGCMYSLGALHLRLRNNEEAERWLSACHDYSPQQTECATALLLLYEANGSPLDAFRQLEIILKTSFQERGMLNHFKHWTCEVPVHATRVYATMLLNAHNGHAIANVTKADAKYLRRLASLADQESCKQMQSSLTPRDIMAVKEVSRAYGLSPADDARFCEDPEVQSYLLEKEYSVHGCEKITQSMMSSKLCKWFAMAMPSPNEKHQLAEAGEFIGAASVPDIVHHVFGGNAHRVLLKDKDSSKKFRVLFAHFFHHNNVYNLLGFISRLDASSRSRFEVTVLHSSDSYLSYISHSIQHCAPAVHEIVKFVVLSPGTSVSTQLRSTGKRLSSGKGFPQFDYIEFNGGPSFDGNSSIVDVSDLKQLLSSDGSIGITYYAKNKYTTEIMDSLRKVDAKAFLPLSENRHGLVKTMLKAYNLPLHAEDIILVNALTMSDLKTYRSKEIYQHLQENGMKVLGWIPTAWRKPYDTIKHVRVQQYQSFGMLEEDFIETIGSYFRITVYATKSDSVLPSLHDRLECQKKRYSIPGTVSHNEESAFISRTSTLKALFSDTRAYAAAMHSIKYQLELSTSSQSLNLQYIILPHALASLAILSDNPTYAQLVNENKQALSPQNYNAALSKHDLDYYLYLFLNTDMLTVWNAAQNQRDWCGAEVEEANNAIPSDASDSSNRDVVDRVKPSLIKSVPNANKNEEKDVHVSGLKVSRKPKSAEASVEAPIQHLASMYTDDAGATSVLPRHSAKSYDRERFLATYRSPSCAGKSAGQDSSSECRKPDRPKRSTAGLLSTSRHKLKFDIAQLKHIALNDHEVSFRLIREVIPKYLLLVKAIPDYGVERKSCAVFSLTSSQYAEVEAVFNRANHLARDTEVSSPSVHSEVFRDVYEVLHGSDAFDYAVIDEALWSRQRSILLQTLSMSTVWFDVTNGRVFAAHHDDGLVQPAFPLVGDELVKSIHPKANLKRFSAVTMSIVDAYGASGIAHGAAGEFTAVVWLNGKLVDDDQEQRGQGDHDGDGLHVFPEVFMECLKHAGVSVTSLIHPDYMSSMGTLNVNYENLCSSVLVDSSTAIHNIPQRDNRVVVIPPNIGFSFFTTPRDDQNTEDEDEDFETSNLFALVFTFEIL